MRLQFIPVLLSIVFYLSIICSSTAQQLRAPSIPSIEDYYSFGYSLGPGQGFSLAMDKILSEAGNGQIGIGGVGNARLEKLRDGSQTHAIAAARLSYHPHLFVSPD